MRRDGIRIKPKKGYQGNKFYLIKVYKLLIREIRRVKEWVERGLHCLVVTYFSLSTTLKVVILYTGRPQPGTMTPNTIHYTLTFIESAVSGVW